MHTVYQREREKRSILFSILRTSDPPVMTMVLGIVHCERPRPTNSRPPLPETVDPIVLLDRDLIFGAAQAMKVIVFVQGDGDNH